MSTFIIAEAGVNHNGSLDTAKALVDVAKESGADAVKFQTFIPENLVTKQAQKAEYQIKNTKNPGSQLEMIKQLSLSFEDFSLLKTYCDCIGIEFLSSPFDLESIDFLAGLNMTKFKIPSGEITNLPYLIKIAGKRKPVILSTGMSYLKEITFAVEILKQYGTRDITVLHCNTQYPTPFGDVNLKAMLNLKAIVDGPVGYSDHTLGIEVPIAAVALGAEVIEKHFTLDKNMVGPDHKASLVPVELKAMVRAIRNTESALGSSEKKPSQSEVTNIALVRKSIVAARNIQKGEIFTEDNLAVKRPGSGISPMLWFEVIGQKARKNFRQDELIEL